MPLPADFSKPDKKTKSSSHPRADPESSSCQREGLVAVLRTRPEVRENHGTMSAWDAKVAFGVRLASLYPIQLLLPGDSGVCFLPPSSGFFQTLKENKSSSHSWSASKKLIVITGGRSALHLSKGKRAMIPCYHVWLGCQSCIRGPSVSLTVLSAAPGPS